MALQRLGETSGFGYMLLELLGIGGWTTDIRPAFAGAGIMVTVSRNGHEVVRTGESVAAVACEVFEEAVRVQRLFIDHDVQLALA